MPSEYSTARLCLALALPLSAAAGYRPRDSLLIHAAEAELGRRDAASRGAVEPYCRRRDILGHHLAVGKAGGDLIARRRVAGGRGGDGRLAAEAGRGGLPS